MCYLGALKLRGGKLGADGLGKLVDQRDKLNHRTEPCGKAREAKGSGLKHIAITVTAIFVSGSLKHP